MTALSADRASRLVMIRNLPVTLTSGQVAYKNAAIGLNLSTGKAVPMSSASNLWYLGTAIRYTNATADTLIDVRLPNEIAVEVFANATGGDAVAAANVGSLAYFLDDQTVTITSTSRSIAGRIVRFDSVKNEVWVQKLEAAVSVAAAPNVMLTGATLSFTAADCAPASVVSNAVYQVPTTAANSTITLPTTDVAAGTHVCFQANGTANGHTVQYRFGTTNITTALTASKAHQVRAVYNGTVWTAIAYVSP